VVTAATQRAPHRLTRYAEDLAGAFHRFYADCRILTDDHALSSARWWLLESTGQVLVNTLSLIGVDAPDRM
jgi:arginyl-tRNA synthetase